MENNKIRIYQHSDLIYTWWIWAYGFFCAGFTYLYGAPVDVGGHVPVLVYSETWLGYSFTAVILIVLLVTSIGSKIGGFVSLLVYGALMLGIWFVFGRKTGFLPVDELGKVLVHMNLAFYIIFSSLLFVMWGVTLFIERRMPWELDFNMGTRQIALSTRGLATGTKLMVVAQGRTVHIDNITLRANDFLIFPFYPMTRNAMLYVRGDGGNCAAYEIKNVFKVLGREGLQNKIANLGNQVQ